MGVQSGIFEIVRRNEDVEMVELAAFVALRRLVEAAEAVEESLMPNEREMLHSIGAKYRVPIDVDPFDATALEVIPAQCRGTQGLRLRSAQGRRPGHRPAAQRRQEAVDGASAHRRQRPRGGLGVVNAAPLVNNAPGRSRTQGRRTAMNESATSNVTVGGETLRDLYVTMRRIRAFEDKTADLFQEGVVKGTAHSYKGQEAIAAGVCATLRDDDIIASYHRGHGHCIAKGARIDRMMAELMGRQTGYCQGLGGSMHIADMELNIMGANGIVGAAMPLATGAGLAARLQGSDRVAVAFFGDGASNQGVFHESLNLAAVWKLPVIFVCENNQYALTTSYRNTTAVSQVSNRARVLTRSPASPWTAMTASRSIWCCARRWTAPAPARGRR